MTENDPADARPTEPAHYVESQVIMTTVRVVAPFAFTYGLFLTFHGGGSPGGGFQGGAIVGATVLMLAFAFGIEPTREWLGNRVVSGLLAGGVVAFALIGVVPVLVGGRFLEHGIYGGELDIYHGTKYALEGVEIAAIAPIVAAAVIGLFFAIAAGVRSVGFGGEVTEYAEDGGVTGNAAARGATDGGDASVTDGGDSSVTDGGTAGVTDDCDSGAVNSGDRA